MIRLVTCCMAGALALAHCPNLVLAQGAPLLPAAVPTAIATPFVPAYEVPAPQPAAPLLGGEAMKGPGYTVEPTADPTGMLYTFRAKTPYGPERVDSLRLMRLRLTEYKAIARLQELSQEDLFLSGVGEQLETTAKATGKALMNPVETIKRMPDGLKKFAGEMQARQTVGQVYGESGSATYAQVKRDLARKLGVDPYSDNEALQNLLNEVAKNKNRGQLVASIGTMVVGGGLGVAMNVADMSEEFNELIRKKSAAQLQLENRAALQALGMTQAQADYFLTTPGYTATNCTAITQAMVALRAVKGATKFFETLQPARGRTEALYIEGQLEMAAAFQKKNKTLKTMRMIGGSPVWGTASGQWHVFSPIEYLYWNEEIALGMENISREVGGAPVQLHISGDVTPTAAAELAARGVTVVAGR